VAALATLAFVILQSGLILALLWQRRQKRAATELLRDSEEKFRKFFTDVPDYCFIVNPDGAIRDANRSALAVLGFERGDLTGRPWRSIYNRPLPSEVERLAAQFRQTGELRNQEITIPSREGLERTALLNAAAVRDAGGAILFSTAVLTDITERKQAHEALRQNEALLKKAEEIGQFGSFSWDVATDTTIWSEGLYRIVGKDPSQPAPRYGERAVLYTPEGWARMDSALKRALAIGEPYDLEEEIIRPDGGHRWVRSIAAPVRDATGRVVRVDGTVQDITARKRAGDALRESEERFRTAFESAAIGMGLVALDGRWLRVNQSLCQIVGYPAEELLARDFQSITHPDDLAANLDLLRQMLDGSIPCYHMEKRYIHKQGRVVWVFLSVALVRSTRGAPLHAIVQIQDITERKEAERSLLREKAFTDAVIDNVPGLFYLLDNRGKAVRWNRRAEQTTGYTLDQASRMDPEEFFQGADRAAVADAFRRVFTEGHAELEANLATKNGGTIPCYFSAARVCFEGEDYLIGNGIDIGARKEMEKALRDSEEKFSKAFRNSPMILSISTLKEGIYLDVNGTFERITGWRRDEVVGRRRDEIGIRTAEARREAAHKILTSGGYRNLESEFHTRSGELRISRVSAETIDFAGQACELTVGEDITEHKGFERELRALNESLERRVKERTTELERAVESLQMLSQAIENAPASVMITDPAGNIEYVNPKFCETTGYSRAEATGAKANLLKSGVHPPEFFQNFWAAIQTGETWRGEFCNRKKNGGTYWESACISTVSDAHGRPRHFVAITEDITELKQAAEELQRAKEAADAASRAKTAFLASMSHEIRTPMHAILGYSQLMLRDDSISPQAKENLRIVNRSGEHLLALINDVLEMSKIESGRLKLDAAEFDLHELLRDLEAMFRLRTMGKGIDLSVHQDDGMPLRVVADEGKVRQILINLLGNAVKFTAAGHIALRATVRELPDRPMLAVEVEDTGAGIAESEMGKLFRPFEQTASGRQAQSGTGLGLAISMEYARLMGGGISVASELGKGSTFRMEIPIWWDRLQPAIQDPPRVPVADDDESHRGWLRNLLGAAGLTADSLAELPPVLTAEMRQAILTGDMDRFTRVLPDVAARNAAVAEGLRELADRYDYDALGELLG
jgi:PAS domain S-box-containing protein